MVPLPAAQGADSGDGEPHPSLRLSRVREQLDRIDGMLRTETDPVKLDRLAAASSRLEEQERRLSQRSLPATLRAEPVRTRPRDKLDEFYGE